MVNAKSREVTLAVKITDELNSALDLLRQNWKLAPSNIPLWTGMLGIQGRTVCPSCIRSGFHHAAGSLRHQGDRRAGTARRRTCL